jgi:cytochrome c-type biogenesis protein CcsB
MSVTKQMGVFQQPAGVNDMNVALFSAVSYIYLFASLAYCCSFFFRLDEVGKAATGITAAGLFAHTAAYAIRWFESHQLGMGHSPFSFFTLYETIVFACWSLTGMYLCIERLFRTRAIGAFVLPFVSLAMRFASASPGISSRIEALAPVLQGNVLAYHVTTCMMSLAAFLIAGVTSGLLLMVRSRQKTANMPMAMLKRLPLPQVLDDISYKTTAVGFILFSMAMATGAYRAKIIWGHYWSWDPVEGGSLIMWLLYALILHGRYQRWWGSTTNAVLSVTAFAAAICSFLIAASYLLSSAHYPIQ